MTTTHLRIAIADDERDMRDYLNEVLPRLGHEVVASAGNGRELATRCQAVKPDLVIADVKMPDMDGIEAARLINQEKKTPVLLVSAHHSNDLLNRAATEPVMGYLIKPVSEADLVSAITIAVHRFRQQQELTKEAADLRQALEDRKIIERAKGIIMKRLRLEELESFRRFRKLASDQNRKLVDVGRTIIAAEEVFHHLDDL